MKLDSEIDEVEGRLRVLREKQPELNRGVKAQVRKLCELLKALPISETVADPALCVEARSRGREGLLAYLALVVEGENKTVYLVYRDAEGNDVEKKELPTAPIADLVEAAKIVDDFIGLVQETVERERLKELEDEYARAVEFAEACVSAYKAYEGACRRLQNVLQHEEGSH